MLKIIVGSFLVLFLLITAVGFFLPDEIQINDQEFIIAPIAYVFEELNELDRWANWSYPQKKDPSAEITYHGIRSGRMASFYLKSDNEVGELVLVESFRDTTLATEFRTEELDTLFTTYKLKQRHDTTTLTVEFQKSGFINPFKRWITLYDRLRIKDQIDYELDKIKEVAEAKPIFTIKITEESLAPTYYISRTFAVDSKNPEQLSAEKKKSFDQLHAVFKAAKAKAIDNPFCLYPGKQITCALPMSPDSKFPPAYPPTQLYSGAAIRGIHIGDTRNIKKSHEEVKEYISYKNFQPNGVPWEVYVKDQRNERDSSKWITEIYYPVK
jgi:hypothetical protein